MIALLDTTVAVDLVGPPGPEKHAAGHVINAALSGRFEPVIALQSLQELLEVKRRQGGGLEPVCEFMRWIGRTFKILPHAGADLDELLKLIAGNPGLSGGDAMIWASANRHGVDVLITRDKAFGEAFGDGWIDPMDEAALMRLLGKA